MGLRDLLSDRSFARRKPRRRDPQAEIKAMRLLAYAVAEGHDSVLQQLTDIAVDFCGADSAGISLLETLPSGEQRFRWVAVSGTFAKYLQGTTPRNYSPCGTTLDRNRPQLYRVGQPYYQFLGVDADDITDGILIPWISGETRGTLWAVSHRSQSTFCPDDYQLLRHLADFAAVAVRHLKLQENRRRQEQDAATAAMANALAHRINNPLQSLTNTLYLAQQGGDDAHTFVHQASAELEQVTELVRKLLLLSGPAARQPKRRQSPPAPKPAPIHLMSASTARTRRKYRAPAAVA